MIFYLFLFSLSINPLNAMFSGLSRTEQELQFVDYDNIQQDLEADGRIDTAISFETLVTGTRTSRSYWKSLVKITNSKFQDCFAFGVALTFGSGGAVYAQQSCLYILESSFNSNKAATGGSIAVVNSRSVVEQATFTFDIAYQRAGSFYAISSDQLSEVDSDDAVISPINEISMIDSSFFMCQSNELYGAAYIYGSTNTYLHNVRFEKCTAKAPCGAIAISESTAFIDSCKFLGNACNVLPDIPNEINTFKSKMINKQKGIPSGGGAIIFSCIDQSKQLVSQNCCFNGNVANYPNLNTFNGAPSIGNDILFQGDAKWRSFQDIFSTDKDNAVAVDTTKTSSVTIDQYGTTFHTVDGVCVTENDVLDYPINSYESTSVVEESSISYDPISYADNTEINQKPDPATKFPNTPVIIGYVSYTLHPHSPEIQFPTPVETPASTAFETPFSTQETTPFLTAFETPFSTAFQTVGETPFNTAFSTAFETPFETPFETAHVTPFETAFQTAGETPFITAFKTEFETPFETAFSTAFETPFETAFVTAFETPFSTAFQTAFETPYITAFQTEFETPFNTVFETPYITEFYTPFETAFSTAFETPFSTAFETAFETPFIIPESSALIPQTPFETAFETAVETPFSTAFLTEFETPFSTAFQTAYETPFETAFSTAFETAFETPFSTVFQTPYITEFETPFSTAFETAFETSFITPESSALIPRTPFETAFETAYETPFSTAFETAFETPFSTAFQTAFETPFSTAFKTEFQTPFETAFSTAHITI